MGLLGTLPRSDPQPEKGAEMTGAQGQVTSAGWEAGPQCLSPTARWVQQGCPVCSGQGPRQMATKPWGDARTAPGGREASKPPAARRPSAHTANLLRCWTRKDFINTGVRAPECAKGLLSLGLVTAPTLGPLTPSATWQPQSSKNRPGGTWGLVFIFRRCEHRQLLVASSPVLLLLVGTLRPQLS